MDLPPSPFYSNINLLCDQSVQVTPVVLYFFLIFLVSIFYHLLGHRNQSRRETQTSSPQGHFLACPGGSRGVPSPEKTHNPSSVFRAFSRASYRWDVPGNPHCLGLFSIYTIHLISLGLQSSCGHTLGGWLHSHESCTF